MTDERIAQIQAAYTALDSGDLAGFLDLFAPDAKFFIEGTNAIAGDHDKTSFAAVLPAYASGVAKREVLDFLVNEASVGVVVHEYVQRGDEEIGYHAIHVWDGPAGAFKYWWIYTHEHTAFERAWTRTA